MSLGLNSPERRYELVERIAVGGMAEVFRAKAYGPHGFEKVLAIKRILPALAQDPSFERRFITEAKVAVSLSHANIVQVFDFSRFGQSLYIVMELVDGCDLSRALQYMREHGVLMPLESAMHVAVEFLKGLEYAHKQGVVHRDLSPSNILLSKNGEVKIADFGIAQMGGSDLVTRTVKIMGKWRYMSPEQAIGQELDARSDVFSAGVVLFELFTGQRLFTGQDSDEIVHNLNTMPLPRVSEVRTDLPPELDGPLLAALERDRNRRRMTAAGLLEAVLEVCYTLSIPALPTSLARYIEQVTDGEPSGERSVSPGLLDEIIVSEIGVGRKGARPDRERHTAMALSPPKMHPDDLPPEEVGSVPPVVAAGGDATNVTMIRSVADPDGMRHWVLEDAVRTVSGRAQRPVSAPGQVIVRMPSVVTPVPFESPPTAPPVAPLRRGTALMIGVGVAIMVVIVVAALIKKARHTEASESVEVVNGIDVGDDAGLPAAVAPPPAPIRQPVVQVADAAPPASTPPPAAPDAAPPSESEPETGRPRDPEAGKPRFGTVDIFSDPWADIYLGQKKVGTAPQRGIKLPYGKHRLRLVNPVQNRSTTVTVTVPTTRPVRVTLPASSE